MKNKKIVIIGSSGHLGYNVTRLLLNKAKKVILLVRRENIYTQELINMGAKIKIVNFDKVSDVNKIIKNQEILINTASRNPYDLSGDILKDNYDITKNIFNATIGTRIRKIINISSSVAFKRKKNKKDKINEKSELNFYENDYVKGKLLSEKFIDGFQKKNKKKIIIRVYPGWIVGDDDIYLTPPLKFFYEKIFKKKIIPCFNGGISINGVKEIANAIIQSININKNEKFLLGGHNLSYYEIIKLFCYNSKNTSLIIKLPNFFIPLIKNILIFFSTNLNYFTKITNQIVYSNQGLKSYLYLSSSKAKKHLNYKIKKIDLLIKDIDNNCNKHLLNINKFGKNNSFPKYEFNIDKIKKNKRLLITGCPGLLGNKFVDFIINYNHKNKDKIYCNLLIEKKYLNLIKLPSEFNIFYGSLRDLKIVKKSVVNVSSVFHLASKIYEPSNKKIYETNYVSSKKFCEILIKNKINRFLYMSTDSVFGYEIDNLPFDNKKKYQPFGAYGKSKKQFEDFLIQKSKEKKINYTILRGFLFFDKNLFAKNKFIKSLYNKIQILIGNGNNYRNVTFKENVVLAFFHCLKSNKTMNKSYWIGDRNYRITIKQLYKKICLLNKIKFKPIFLPNFLGYIFLTKFNFLNLLGFNSGLLFTLSKLNLSITAKVEKIYKDTNYQEIVSFKGVKINEK
ncbi:NAD-dependent epimerase/dehydratase family protein [Candidatus Pelagibacter sp.]|nr:NAD-dependent epimerase/dehydratase family protein [Candidatus Pelagibacter sp.]